MATKREQILVALHAAFGSLAGTAVTRNAPLTDFDAAGNSFANLIDGTSGQTDAFINPPTYEFTMTPALILMVKGDDAAARDAALDAMIEAADAAMTAALADGLGGLVTDIRVQPADYAPEALWGAADMKGAELPIELDYWSTSSLG